MNIYFYYTLACEQPVSITVTADSFWHFWLKPKMTRGLIRESITALNDWVSELSVHQRARFKNKFHESFWLIKNIPVHKSHLFTNRTSLHLLCSFEHETLRSEIWLTDTHTSFLTVFIYFLWFILFLFCRFSCSLDFWGIKRLIYSLFRVRLLT